MLLSHELKSFVCGHQHIPIGSEDPGKGYNTQLGVGQGYVTAQIYLVQWSWSEIVIRQQPWEIAVVLSGI